MSRRFILRRLAQVPFAILAILLVTFALLQAAPTDPAYLIAGPDANPQAVARARHDFGLDKPIPEQFVSYVGRAVRGDLGQSYTQGRSVSSILWSYAKPTLLLTGTALVLSTLFGIFLGVAVARRPFGWFDKGVNTVALVVYAVPGFWLAQLAIIYVVLKLHLFPLQGYSEVGTGAPTGIDHLADVARHLALPVLLLAFTEVAAVTRVVRAGLIGEMGQPYVLAADAKGVAPDRVMSHHALRNTMLPLLTLIGARIGFLLSGAVVIETLFAWPGLGTAIRGAAESQDRPLILGMVVLLSVVVMLVNLATDFAYALVDPRIRYE